MIALAPCELAEQEIQAKEFSDSALDSTNYFPPYGCLSSDSVANSYADISPSNVSLSGDEHNVIKPGKE